MTFTIISHVLVWYRNGCGTHCGTEAALYIWHNIFSAPNLLISGHTPPIHVLPFGTYCIASITLSFFVSQMPFRAFSYVCLIVMSVFKFSSTDQCKVSIEVNHHDIYVRLSLWLKSLVVAPESLNLILPYVPGLFNVGLEIAGNASLHIRLSLHVALNIAALTHHYISLKGTLISLISAAY